MRGALALLAVLALLLTAPAPAQAQEADADATHVLDDPSGDVAAATPAADLQSPTDRGAIDILALDVEEKAEDFVVRLTLAGVPPQHETPLVDDLEYAIAFAYGGASYLLLVHRGIPVAGGIDKAVLAADPQGGTEYAVVREGLEVAREGTVLSATLPRTLVVDTDGAPAFAGRSLTGFFVQAASTGGALGLSFRGAQAGPPQWADSASSDVAVPVRFGVVQEGGLRLEPEQPFRASNGEAALFRFPVTVRNNASEEDLVHLDALEVPAGWSVRLPGPVAVPAGGEAVVDVLADVPFTHKHGSFSTFKVEARGVLDAGSVGRAMMGLLYVDPAQPAAHHDTLYLHSHRDRSVHEAWDTALGSASGAVSATWNTLDDDPADLAIPVPPDFYGVTQSTDAATYTWSVPLQPALAIGLDFDSKGAGELSVPIATTLPAPGATLRATVHVVDDADVELPFAADAYRVVAASEPTPAQDLPERSTTTLAAAITATDAGNYVPHAPGQQLWLRIELTIARGDLQTGGTTPHLAPGAWVRLPLLEYSDRDDPLLLPAGSVGPEGPEAAPAKDAPAAPWAALAAVAVAVAVGRRRGL